MFILDGSVVTSASDLTEASKCEFAFLRRLDVKLGRAEGLELADDPMYVRTSRLGDEHERRVLERYRAEHGSETVEIARQGRPTAEALAIAVDETVRAFRGGAKVVFQATFFDGSFLGYADFIVRQPDGRYQVQDTKLARSARVTALLQLAAYAEQLEKNGIPTSDTVQLLLGDGSISEHRLDDIAPVYRKRRERLLHVVEERLAEPEAVHWGDLRYAVCGHCDWCAAEIERTRDVLLTAGMRVTQRAHLAAAGIRTIDELAATPLTAVDGIAEATLTSMKLQAQLQRDAVPGEPPPITVYNASALAVLPNPSAGDVFFDFEGDPLYTEGAGERWHLDYLFGVVDIDETFTSFWAHDFAQERIALRGFLDWLSERRKTYPDLHVYHYASYERTHLLSLAARHGTGEDDVDDLLRQNVLVDLYPVVRKALRVGSRSYSIKKLEPLYMGTELRESEVQTAAASITDYASARDLIATGDVAEGQRMLDEIGDYNRYDCVSTLRLRDWLLARAADHGIRIGELAPDKTDVTLEPSPLRDGLLSLAGNAGDPDRSDDERALAFAAAAVDYHQREDKIFWQEHFTRLVQPIDEWADTRDVLVVESARVERDWYREGRQTVDRRVLRLTGQWGPGSNVKASNQAGPFLLYEYPGPFSNDSPEPGARTYKAARVIDVDDDGSVLIEELVPKNVGTFDRLPSALTPGGPPRAVRLVEAIAEWGKSLLGARTGTDAPSWPADPMVDILRRVPPRTRAAVSSPALTTAGKLTASLLDLDNSYLAVQGPPGTGKTYLGAQVIAELVGRHGWKIGVVGQSHSVVENLLDAVVAAGLTPGLVGKAPRTDETPGTRPHEYTELEKDAHLIFALDRRDTGYVIGGTGWDFANTARIPRRSLDLLVVDEAGQYSLASTIAASVAAHNLLLLGDPQQLPQVSQGTHPEPVDQSALGWVSAGHDVLPPELGYFLAESRRMHPALTAPVSRLSYEGKLRAHPDAATRHLDGIQPGLHVVPIAHDGNATESPEEARAVVDLVSRLLGRRWTDPTSPRHDDPLAPDDLIVVTPYNAQLALVRDLLDAAGYADVRAGTVDKFQGRQAVVAIVTLAASSAVDVPRGMSFLIMKNRLNVAISRAQWAAYLVHSPALTEYLPVTPAGVAELSAFITLVETKTGR